ncbi:hypothetical protein V6N13_023670 [Hibiscus sabdariffa]
MELSEIVVKEWAKGWSLDGWKKRWESVLCNAYETADNVVKDESLAPKLCWLHRFGSYRLALPDNCRKLR